MGRLLMPLATIWLISAIGMGLANLFVSAKGPGFTPNSGFTDSGQSLIDQSPTQELPEVADLRTNAAGLKIIQDSEGLRFEAYQGTGGKWLIGYGHASTAKPGMTITEQQALDLLRQDVEAAETAIKSFLTVPVTENEFSAMVSLAYNIGVSAFKDSTVLREVNRNKTMAAADAFLLWNKVNGRAYPHLTDRRQKERALFLAP